MSGHIWWRPSGYVPSVFPNKKHVEDDISRALSDLGKSAMKNEFLRDVFGDERNKEKGIVDSTSETNSLLKFLL